MNFPESLNALDRFRHAGRVPGLLLAILLAITAREVAILIGVDGMGFERSPVSPVLLSILLGLAIRNITGVPEWTNAGLVFARDQILKAGIVLMGFQVGLGAISTIGLEAIPVVIACIVSALLIVSVLARVFGLSAPLATLIGVGTSICGCSAIIATAPVIRARQSEVCYAVACVALFGTIGMLAYPFLAHELFGARPQAAGVFLGTAIHDTAQVIGAGMLYEQYFNSPAGLEAATVTKLVRNMTMVIVIPALAWRFRSMEPGQTGGGAKLATYIPLFIFGFLAMSLVRTVGDVYADSFDQSRLVDWQTLITFGKQSAEVFLTIAMAAVGLSTSLRGIRNIGPRPLLTGLAAASLVGVVSVTMIFLFV